MISMRVWLYEPGDPQSLWAGRVRQVPTVGERVEFVDGGDSYEVVSVTWLFDGPSTTAAVRVR